MSARPEPARDFLVLTKNGDRRAGPVYAEEAVMIMRLIPEAHSVVRMSDGAVIATKLRGPLKDQRPNPRVPGMYPGIGGFGAN